MTNVKTMINSTLILAAFDCQQINYFFKSLIHLNIHELVKPSRAWLTDYTFKNESSKWSKMSEKYTS